MAAFFEVGNYRCRITAQALGTTNNGNPELQLTILPIAAISREGAETDLGNQFTRTVYLVLTPATIGTPEKPGWVLDVLILLGFRGKSFSQLDPDAEGHHSFVGLEPTVRCSHNNYQGKISEKWNVVRPGAGTGPRPAKPIEKKAVKALDAKFGKTLAAIAARTPASEVKVPDSGMAPVPAGRVEDAIPF